LIQNTLPSKSRATVASRIEEALVARMDVPKEGPMNPMTPPFSANVVHLDGNAIVMLVGELDLDSGAVLARVLDELTENGPPEIILDASNLDFIDSSGIAVLIAAQERLRAKDRHLRISSPKPLVMRVFAITNLTEYLNVGSSQSVQ
jgi:anti-sigma B factor antagonist